MTRTRQGRPPAFCIMGKDEALFGEYSSAASARRAFDRMTAMNMGPLAVVENGKPMTWAECEEAKSCSK